jgi:hypothetical protein
MSIIGLVGLVGQKIQNNVLVSWMSVGAYIHFHHYK